MRILLVAMSNSVHVARWISQISDQGWEVFLFPSIDNGRVHPDIKNVSVYHSLYSKRGNLSRSVKISGIPVGDKDLAFFLRMSIDRFFSNYRVLHLKHIIKRIKPDIIHTLEFQHAGYLALSVKKIIKRGFPPWIATNWGSDIYLFGRLADHEPKIRNILSECSYYSCECERDVCLAMTFGFKGKVLPVFPNAGGYHLDDVFCLRKPGTASNRKIIMLKGYQNWHGRGMVGLRALERCADILQGYEVIMYSVSDDVRFAAELFQDSTKIKTTIIPNGTPHKEIMKLHGHARISIGLSISDGISTSLLESIVMGSFPIQSWTSCADEWIDDGKTGILVPPDDSDEIAKAIRRALADDDLVDEASIKNYKLAEEKLDSKIIKQKAIDIYNRVYKENYRE